MSDCPFCLIVAGEAPVDLIAHWPNVWAITPLNPVTPGHVLFIPTVHVTDFAEDPAVSSSVMFRAAQWAQGRGACNLLTSLGADASQSVFHFHLHYVPRRPGDGLMLPWPQHTDGRGELASFISADGATDRGTLSAPVAPTDPTAAQTPSVSVPLGGAS